MYATSKYVCVCVGVRYSTSVTCWTDDLRGDVRKNREQSLLNNSASHALIKAYNLYLLIFKLLI